MIFLAADQFDRAETYCGIPGVRKCIALEAGSSLPAFAEWRDAADQAQTEVDVADQQVKHWSGRRKGAKQRVEAARQRHEHALSRRDRVDALYPELRGRLQFHAGLPKDVTAGIHGGVGLAVPCAVTQWRARQRSSPA